MIKNDEIQSILNKYNKGLSYPVSPERFIEHAKRYIKAIKEHRMICSIGSVSASGMSRTIKFLEVSKGGKNRYNLLNFYEFFKIMGYSLVKDSDYFRIGGCGMDMIFNTNYTIMHDLKRLGFITDEECRTLAQKTPSVV